LTAGAKCQGRIFFTILAAGQAHSSADWGQVHAETRRRGGGGTEKPGKEKPDFAARERKEHKDRRGGFDRIDGIYPDLKTGQIRAGWVSRGGTARQSRNQKEAGEFKPRNIRKTRKA